MRAVMRWKCRLVGLRMALRILMEGRYDADHYLPCCFDGRA